MKVACVCAIASFALISAFDAAPASAYKGSNCVDRTSGTVTVYTSPANENGSLSWGTLSDNTLVTDASCDYYNNTHENRWFVKLGFHGNTGYVWVQRLGFGSDHECTDGSTFVSKIDDPSGGCRLTTDNVFY